MGILGGTFNPLHLGHLVMAQEAHVQLRLDRVVLIPVATPPATLVPWPGWSIPPPAVPAAITSGSRPNVPGNQ